MKKKAQTGAIVGTIIVVLVIIGFITVLIIAVQKGNNPEENIDLNPLKFYLKAIDENSNEFIDSTYGIYSNGTLISQGELQKDSFTEIEVPRQVLEVYSYNDNYYFRKAYKIFASEELIENSSKMTIELMRIGNINVKHSGKLSASDTTSIIKLNISSEGWYYKPKICISWTPGIISVNKPNDYITCDKGPWLNYSKYNPEEKEYIWLENNYWRCGEDWLEQCEYVNINKCRILDTKIPYRYLGLVDTCIYLGKSLNNETLEVPLEIKTSNLNSLDQITFYIMDSDRRWNQNEQMFTWMTEDFEGNNIGNSEDMIYKINYKEA